MLNKRREAAMKVAQGLFALEKAIDDALTQCAEFHAMLPAARAEANLSPIVGQEAFEGAAAVFAALAQARTHMVETHKRLDQTKAQIGLRTVNFGDGQGKAGNENGHLTVVPTTASEAA
jgi:hypothetical protein